MALEGRAKLTQRDEVRLGEVARPRHDRVERGDAVALGEDDAVPVGPIGAAGGAAHPPQAERGGDIDHRERGARRPPAPVGGPADALPPAAAGPPSPPAAAAPPT